MAENNIMITEERTLKDRIYIIRGVQVMLDFELAEIYGYTTGKMNERVKENAERFKGEEFRFQLTKDEYDNLKSEKRISSWGGRRTLPYAFTEQGIYMLMTILKGDLAIKQSRKLVRLFKHMKDYINENPALFINQQLLSISAQTAENTMAIKRIEESMVSHDDLSEIMKLFDQGIEKEEVLILDGQPFKANVAYQKIYRSATKSIIVVDDYIGVKTLQHLVHARQGIKLTIISDNKSKHLKLSEYNDFLSEYPTKTVDFIKTQGRTHDRYIVLDNGTKGMKVYHCGASSKDAGQHITTIARITDIDDYKNTIKDLLSNSPLTLK